MCTVSNAMPEAELQKAESIGPETTRISCDSMEGKERAKMSDSRC